MRRLCNVFGKVERQLFFQRTNCFDCAQSVTYVPVCPPLLISLQLTQRMTAVRARTKECTNCACFYSGVVKPKQKATTLSMFSLVMKDQSFRLVVRRKTRSIREKSDFKSGMVVYVTRKVFQSFPRIFPISHQILLRQQNPKRYSTLLGFGPLQGRLTLRVLAILQIELSFIRLKYFIYNAG